MSDAVRIGVLGDFTPEFASHHATNASLQHAAARLGAQVESQWLSTPSLLKSDAHKALESCDGLWASPGSPYKSLEGMLKGIEFARRHDWPFFGTCGGFQYALIECARNVLGIADADTAETFAQTRDFIRKTKLGSVQLSVLTPFPWQPSLLSGHGPTNVSKTRW